MPALQTPLAALLAAALLMPAARAATSVMLPSWVCTEPDAIFASRFDAVDAVVPHDPSGGSGGAYPGKSSRTLHIAGLGSGTQKYYIYLPPDYTPSRPWPLLLALHGVAPLGDSYAKDVRDAWAIAASADDFIVAAPVADEVTQCWNGTQYVACETWSVPPSSGPTDYDLFAALRVDMEGAYNIDRTRVYGWGFSAGGHVMHELALTGYSTAFNADTMAAYSVSGGVLQGQACPGPTNAGCAPLLAALPRRIPVDIHVGDSDPNYPDAVSDHALFLSSGWSDGVDMHFVVFSGGHDYTAGQLGAIWNNICPNAVTP